MEHQQHAQHSQHAQHQHAGHEQHGGGRNAMAANATLHCLTGCAIGELAGLMIGVTLGLGAWPTMALATALGFASGFALGLRPLLKSGMSLAQAWRAIWLGEAISIAVMEFAMNFADYHAGGVAAASILAPRFWLGFAVALPAGFAAAWPVNYLLLRKSIKKPCH